MTKGDEKMTLATEMTEIVTDENGRVIGTYIDDPADRRAQSARRIAALCNAAENLTRELSPWGRPEPSESAMLAYRGIDEAFDRAILEEAKHLASL